MQQPFVIACATLLVVTGLVHSLLGERRLIGPLLRQRPGILASPMARLLIRFCWHLLSLLWWLLAVTLLALTFRPDIALQVALIGTGAVFTTAGLFDAAATRGKHIGWPMLTAIGVFALAAAGSVQL